MALAVGWAIALTGCVAEPASTASPSASDGPPAWVEGLAEGVSAVPPIESPRTPPLATPSAEPHLNDAWPWGSPKDLTQPLKPADEPVGARVDDDRPAHRESSGGGRDGGEGSTRVVVNVSTPDRKIADPPRRTDASAPDASAPDASDRSRLERLYRGRFEREANRRLEQFGYAYFAKSQDPSARPDSPDVDTPAARDALGPVPDGYIIGPGDELILTLSDGVEAYHRLVVDRDGRLTIPDFGAVTVAGKRFDELTDHLRAFLQRRRKGFSLTVSMGRLRRISVRVVGRVNRPGIVQVSALSTALDALSAAGGPTKDGSLRRIELRRGQGEGAQVRPVDAYQFLLGPDEAFEPTILRDGDTLRVPPIGPTVGVAGYVQRPAIYELADPQTTLERAIELAGGLTPFTFTPMAVLERTVQGRGRQRLSVPLSEEGLASPMRNGELLMIEAVDQQRQRQVRIEGEVARPGGYPHQPGMTLGDLIRRADGLTVEAYLPQAFISRQLGQADPVPRPTQRLALRQTRRVLVVDLEKALAGEAGHDVALMPLDQVTVRARDQARVRPIVEILGPVQRPGVYELTAKMRVSDLVAVAGNPTPEAYHEQAELIRRVYDSDQRRMDVKRYRIDLRAALSGQAQHNPVLADGDRLIVRALARGQVRVEIQGRVRFPGPYIFPAGARISDLIAAAGGTLADADLRAAEFTRLATQRLQRQRLDHLAERTRRLYEAALERMVQRGHRNEAAAAKLALAQTQNTLRRMRRLQPDGRIVIPFTRDDFLDSHHNLTLEQGDRLVIPRRHRTVSVAGYVFRPLSLVAEERLSVAEALQRAGGLTEKADAKRLYVLRANGRVDSVAQRPRRLSRSTNLRPGDVLLVPREPMRRTLGAKASDLLLMARQIAEIALIASQVGKDLDVSLVSPYNPREVGGVEEAILEEVR